MLIQNLPFILKTPGLSKRGNWDEEKELVYFSIVDVIEILTDTDRPRKSWNGLKTKLKSEGSELSEKIGPLKMRVPDGKMRMKDVADSAQERICQTN
jgi:hypothetical protein